MVKVIAAGTSFTFGSALHFYERAKNNKELTFSNLEPIEYENNVKNSYSSLLAKKFDGESVILGTSGYYNSFLDSIVEIKKLVEQESNVKIVLFQLANPERDFFIYNDIIYYLDIKNYNSFIDSKNKLISTLDNNIDKDDFELLCWDFVSTPSNPGSYMKEAGMMNESKLPNQNNQYQKVNSIITDILCANGTCPIF